DALYSVLLICYADDIARGGARMTRRTRSLLFVVAILAIVVAAGMHTAAHAQSTSPGSLYPPAPTPPGVTAVSTMHLHLTPSAANPKPGNDVAVTLTVMTAGAPLGSWTVDVSYDPVAVQLAGCDAGAAGA